MSVHLTRIYTKTGDDGTTALGDLSRVRKTDPRLAAYADVDEANSAIGVALALGDLPADIRAVLTRIQNDLFDLGADLSVPRRPATGPAGAQADGAAADGAEAAAPTELRVTDVYVRRLERDCDEFNARLAKLNSFLLPGGTPGAALLHVARTVARRAERSTWALADAEPDRTGAVPGRYLNRLSDLLFILARCANPDGDVLWRPGANR